MQEVLVVDDDPDICLILQDVLEAEGCMVIVAHNGQEALRVLEQRRPDVIVLDLMMPVMDGWEFAARLQQAPRWSIPVVVVSADTLAARRKPAARRRDDPQAIRYRAYCADRAIRGVMSQKENKFYLFSLLVAKERPQAHPTGGAMGFVCFLSGQAVGSRSKMGIRRAEKPAVFMV